MHPILIVIGIGWVAFWAYWLVAAFTAKSSRGSLGRLAVGRIVVILVLIVILRNSWSGHHGHTDLALTVIGLVLWVAGLGLAVWARLYIGRNWGMPMTKRDQPDLVTTGPYRFIRHPIYSGIILAFVGTALAISLAGLIVAAVLGAFFVFSASREEHFLAQEFPDTYPDYKARTKMLIPFVL